MFDVFQAFFQGKLKLKGNMGLAMKLREFQVNIEKGKLWDYDAIVCPVLRLQKCCICHKDHEI